MEEIVVVGIRTSKGTYQGNDYDNRYLVYDISGTEGCEGACFAEIKVKAKNINGTINIGDTVEIVYDRFKNAYARVMQKGV